MTIKFNQSTYGNLALSPFNDSPYTQDIVDNTPAPPPGSFLMITEDLGLFMEIESGTALMITES